MNMLVDTYICFVKYKIVEINEFLFLKKKICVGLSILIPSNCYWKSIFHLLLPIPFSFLELDIL